MTSLGERLLVMGASTPLLPALATALGYHGRRRPLPLLPTDTSGAARRAEKHAARVMHQSRRNRR